MQQVLHIATFLPFSIPTRLWWKYFKTRCLAPCSCMLFCNIC